MTDVHINADGGLSTPSAAPGMSGQLPPSSCPSSAGGGGVFRPVRHSYTIDPLTAAKDDTRGAKASSVTVDWERLRRAIWRVLLDNKINQRPASKEIGMCHSGFNRFLSGQRGYLSAQCYMRVCVWLQVSPWEYVDHGGHDD